MESLSKNTNAQIVVYNAVGEKIRTNKLNGDDIFTMDVSGWCDGIYFCTIIVNSDIIAKAKFIVSK